MLGSVEGARGNRRPYSNITIPDRGVHDEAIWVFSFAGIRILAGLACPPHDFRLLGSRHDCDTHSLRPLQ
jgi:hypothetical protein